MAGGISIFEITMTVPDATAVIRSLVEREYLRIYPSWDL